MSTKSLIAELIVYLQTQHSPRRNHRDNDNVFVSLLIPEQRSFITDELLLLTHVAAFFVSYTQCHCCDSAAGGSCCIVVFGTSHLWTSQ